MPIDDLKQRTHSNSIARSALLTIDIIHESSRLRTCPWFYPNTCRTYEWSMLCNIIETLAGGHSPLIGQMGRVVDSGHNSAGPKLAKCWPEFGLACAAFCNLLLPPAALCYLLLSPAAACRLLQDSCCPLQPHAAFCSFLLSPAASFCLLLPCAIF